MGQRTQMLIIRKVTEIDGTQKVTKSIYHKQWGQGKQMYLGMMSAIMNYMASYNPDDFKPTTEGFYPVRSGNNRDLTEEEARSEAEFLKDVDFDRQDTIHDVFNKCDNNDGGLVIELTHVQVKVSEVAYTMRAGFVLGKHAAGKNCFRELVSPQEYMTHVGLMYFSSTFMPMFDAVCRHTQVEWVTRKVERETRKKA